MTELDDDHAALVADPESNSLDIYIPAGDPEANIPSLFVFLCACAARYESDPAWAESMIDWFMDVHSNRLH